jgi:hypothetical protein
VCDVHTYSVWCSHAECDDCYKQMSVISTRRLSFQHTFLQWWVWLWHLYVLKPHYACRNHSCVWCLHAYFDENTHECNFWTQNVISIRTSVIYVCRVWFLHAECNFHTLYDVETHKSDFYTQSLGSVERLKKINKHIQIKKKYTQDKMLTMTRMSVIMTLKKVIMTLIRVKTTLCV